MSLTWSKPLCDQCFQHTHIANFLSLIVYLLDTEDYHLRIETENLMGEVPYPTDVAECAICGMLGPS